jgi:hypothetical protein
MIIGQFVSLTRDCIGNIGPAVADIDTIETGEAVEQLATILIAYINALSTSDDAGTLLALCKILEKCKGVQHAGAILLLQHSPIIVGLYPNRQEKWRIFAAGAR